MIATDKSNNSNHFMHGPFLKNIQYIEILESSVRFDSPLASKCLYTKIPFRPIRPLGVEIIPLVVEPPSLVELVC